MNSQIRDGSKDNEERVTIALNLLDIENRINELQVELDEMHRQKEILLNDRNSLKTQDFMVECCNNTLN